MIASRPGELVNHLPPPLIHHGALRIRSVWYESIVAVAVFKQGHSGLNPPPSSRIRLPLQVSEAVPMPKNYP